MFCWNSGTTHRLPVAMWPQRTKSSVTSACSRNHLPHRTFLTSEINAVWKTLLQTTKPVSIVAYIIRYLTYQLNTYIHTHTIGFYTHTGHTLCGSYAYALVYCLRRAVAVHDVAWMPFSTIWPTSQGVATSWNSYCLRHISVLRSPWVAVAASGPGPGSGPSTAVFHVTWKYGDFKGHTTLWLRYARRADSGLSATAVLYVVGGFTATCFGRWLRSHHQGEVHKKNCIVKSFILFYAVHLQLQLSQNMWEIWTIRCNNLLRRYEETARHKLL